MSIEEAQVKQQRRLAVATTALFVVAAGLVGLVRYQQTPKFAPTTIIAQTGLDPVSQEKTKRANIAQAAVLRDHWRGWAEKHKDLLIAMRQAKGDPTDLAARLNEELPNSLNNGMPHSDLQTGSVQFTWQPRGTKTALAEVKNPEAAKSLNKERQIIEKQFVEGLSKHKDVILSRSVNVGPTWIALWASGRVTVSTNYTAYAGPGYVSKEGEPQELQPPYDFVR